MKSNCEFTVLGMDMECPTCGELVHSGNRHECEWDGGVGTRRTTPSPLKPLIEKPIKLRKLAPSGGRE